MTGPTLTPALMASAAREIAGKIAAQLDADFTAPEITLTRDEAVIIQGVLEAAAERLESEGG